MGKKRYSFNFRYDLSVQTLFHVTTGSSAEQEQAEAVREVCQLLYVLPTEQKSRLPHHHVFLD